jgi:hypothetical protein
VQAKHLNINARGGVILAFTMGQQIMAELSGAEAEENGRCVKTVKEQCHQQFIDL